MFKFFLGLVPQVHKVAVGLEVDVEAQRSLSTKCEHNKNKKKPLDQARQDYSQNWGDKVRYSP
jgi:hypothetical protein